jgi:hypothetical protein
MLKNAVQSVLTQGDFVKVHILDNASTDGTQTWLQELQRCEGARVELTLRKENIGALANFSEGFSSVTTPYSVPLADDDELLPEFLHKALGIAETNPGIGGVIFQTKRNHPDGSIDISPDFEFEGIIHPHKHIEIWCRSGHYVSWSSILWNSEITKASDFLSNVGKFTYFGDAWLQFIVISRYPFYLTKKVGSVFNFHESQLSQNICQELIIDYTNIYNLIAIAVEKNNSFVVDQKNLLKNSLLKNWNSMLEQQCPNFVEKLSIDQKSGYINCYLKNLDSLDKFTLFPFLSFFDKYNILFDALRKYEAEVSWLRKNWVPKSELELIHKSKSWKITAPLRLIDQLFQKLNIK